MHPAIASILVVCLFVTGLPIRAGAPSAVEAIQSSAARPALAEAGKVVPNLRVVAPGLLRGGQPTAQGLKLLKEAGVRTVINLRTEAVLVAREAAVAKQLGLDYFSIPLTVFDAPAGADIERFLSLVAEVRRQPVFVHCLHGRDRTGTLVAIYRIKNQGWTSERAYAEMTELGFRPGFANLSAAVFQFADRPGRLANQPSGKAIAQDIKQRLGALLKR